MFVIKHIAAGSNVTSDQTRANHAKARAGALDASAISNIILSSLDPVLAPRPGLKTDVTHALTKWVANEVGFITAQTAPASAIAGFYEKQQERLADFINLAVMLVGNVVAAIPPGDRDPGVLEVDVPLVSLLRNPAALVHGIVENIIACHFDGASLKFGAGVAGGVVARLCRASNITEKEARQRAHRLKWPKDSDASGVDLVTTYLGGTELADILLSPVSIKISDKVRMEHCLITAGAGHGKSQTLQHMIARDLDRPKGHHVGMVVIDSQGDLINNIQNLKAFAGNDRLLLVDASDVEFPIALNIFDLGGNALSALSLREREQALAATVQLYEYVIGGLFGADMTQKQSTVFRFLIRLMLAIPGATIHTLRECLEEPKKYIHHMERLPPTARHFFLHEFLDKQFGETRKQILRRLYGVLQNPAFERMFASRENRLNLYTALNEGRVVLCNTSREFLQDECRVFGRYCIAVALKAAFDRARIAPDQRRTSYLYIDEASDYFDESVGQLLAQARKYKLGLVLAHQALDQMGDGLRAIVMSNTSVKLAGGASVKDARTLSGELRTTPEFILAQEKQGSATRFATFVRNVTPQAVSWRVPFLTLEKAAQMSRVEHAELIARNRREVSSGPAQMTSTNDNHGTFSTALLDDDFSETY